VSVIIQNLIPASYSSCTWIGQAQYIRIPYADFNALKLPPGKEFEADFILLAGTLPPSAQTYLTIQVKSSQTDFTLVRHLSNRYVQNSINDSTSTYLKIFLGWHGVEISGFQAGESIAVFGAGPVGLMAAYSAVLRGASHVYVVDRVPERLAAAEKINCTAVDFSKGDPVEQIIKLNGGMVDRSVDAVGYQAVGKGGSAEEPNIVLENMIKVTRACGGLGIPGLYVPRYDYCVD
jgi:threonine dehydrogenase-like Zn-dependent dehydrogenase